MPDSTTHTIADKPGANPQDLETIAITGGTFDPIHRGHVEPVRQICEHVKLSSVRYIPAAVPPHRDQPQVSADQRLAMVALAVEAYPELTVDGRELQRAGPSYTIDTLTELRGEYPDASLILLLGLDAFLGLPTWHRWTDVLNVAHIIVMNRPGWSPPEILPAWWQNAAEQDSSVLYAERYGRIVSIDITPVDASSTQVRQRIDAGDMPYDLLAPSVAAYIREHNLYGLSADRTVQSDATRLSADNHINIESPGSTVTDVNKLIESDAVEQIRDVAVDRIDDAKGLDITVNDVRGMTDITDYMIIASGTSDRHVHAVAERVSEGMRNIGLKPVGTEGTDDAEWIVLDYGDVVVHIMRQSVRAYYDLDGLWNEKVRKLVEANREQSESDVDSDAESQ